MLLDMPRYRRALASPRGWVHLANRKDRLEASPDGAAVRVNDDPWSSDLHACAVMPTLGRRVFEKALKQWPIAFAKDREAGGAIDDVSNPEVTFVIPFRGVDRIEQLRWVVRSVMAQRGCRVECLLIEQSADTVVDLGEGDWPPGVRHVHLPHPTNSEGWHKAWAFNEGVKQGRASVIVCHDGDIVVPQDYASEVLKTLDEQDAEVLHLQRLLFCLGRSTTERVTNAATKLGVSEWMTGLERVRQNWQGGTLAITRQAYKKIGGFDESFVDWGGEDNEFFDRCKVLKRWDFGYLPFVHLWHPPQDTKRHEMHRNQNLEMLAEKLEISREQRIAGLTGQEVAT